MSGVSPVSTRPLLQKYLIGTVKGSNTFRVQFANDKEDHTLYERIKTQVMQHLQDKKVIPWQWMQSPELFGAD